MTASIPGENDTKRHRIALAALPSSCQPATLCRRQNPVECRRTERPWYIEAVGDRASSSCMRAEQHTREKCTAPPSRPKFAQLRWFIRPNRDFSKISRIHKNTSRIRIQLAERRRFISRMMCLRPGGIAFHITPLRPVRAVLPPTRQWL